MELRFFKELALPRAGRDVSKDKNPIASQNGCSLTETGEPEK
jgi:hypothetical protein